MTKPRRHLPGEVSMLTRRTLQRRYFLRPDDFINRAVGFEIAKAANRTGQKVHGVCAMSNHLHIAVSDTTGDRSEFMQEAMSGIARSRNDDLGREGYFWGAGQYGDTRMLDRNAIERKLLYIWLNPVRAGLVKKVEDWPGFQILPKHWGETIEIPCPDRFYGRRTPDVIEFTPQPPPGFEEMSLEEVKAHFQELLEQRNRELLEAYEGRNYKGVDAVRATAPKSRPEEKISRRTINPRFSTLNGELMDRAKQRRRDFLETYQKRRQRWLKGMDVTFPAGTIQLRKEAPVDCRAPDPDEPGLMATD